MPFLTFDELNAEQRSSLKQNYLVSTRDSVSWGELAAADSLVSDEELRKEYGDTIFSPDDFWL